MVAAVLRLPRYLDMISVTVTAILLKRDCEISAGKNYAATHRLNKNFTNPFISVVPNFSLRVFVSHE